MGAAFEVNKQMCDIDKHLSEAGYFRKICEGQIEARKKLIDMEKKKMTKAEAFEWLKWKKIVTEGKEQEVLEKLFSIGFTWKDGATERLKFKEYECFGLSYQNTGLVWWGSQYPEINQFNLLGLDAIGADDVLGIEIVEEEKKPDCERNEHVKALQELIAKSGCIDCIIISKNDVGILKK